MRLLVAEQELDRVLDGEDVAGELLVAPLQHRGQRGALAGAGGAHHQDQAALLQTSWLSSGGTPSDSSAGICRTGCSGTPPRSSRAA
jgi:hypothetical protein